MQILVDFINIGTKDLPGPGQYEPVSVFDKNLKVRPPLN
jgi:hypothetical protein